MTRIMATVTVKRNTKDDSVEVATEHCKILYLRPKSDVLVLKMEGRDCSAIYAALLHEIESDLPHDFPVALFIDTCKLMNASFNIKEWARFLSLNHQLFRQVHVLSGSLVVEMSAKIIKHLSFTGDLIRLYTHPPAYTRQLSLAVTTAAADSH